MPHPDASKEARRFTDRAQAYAKHRPGYPAEVFDALFEGLDAARLVVADVGAGTGISSAALAERVARVIAIEPNRAMRARAQPHANLEWREGAAEATGLAEKSVDFTVAFQAFHWFDPQAAFREFVRISRRRVGMAQYERDESAPFSAAYAATIAPYMLDDTEKRRMRALEDFTRLCGTQLRAAQVPFAQELDLESLIGRIDSSSYLPKTGAQAQALRAQARALFARFARGGRVRMAMRVYVYSMDVA